jgi:hypothetical protein
MDLTGQQFQAGPSGASAGAQANPSSARWPGNARPPDTAMGTRLELYASTRLDSGGASSVGPSRDSRRCVRAPLIFYGISGTSGSKRALPGQQSKWSSLRWPRGRGSGCRCLTTPGRYAPMSSALSGPVRAIAPSVDVYVDLSDCLFRVAHVEARTADLELSLRCARAQPRSMRVMGRSRG